MKLIRSLFRTLPTYLLWLLLSSMFWMWIFTFVKDAPKEKKIVLYASVPSIEAKALSIRLEEDLPDGIRMIRARSFDYVMFDERNIQEGDLYIIPASAIEAYLEDYIPIEPDGTHTYYYNEGQAYGIRVYDAESGRGAAGAYIQYALPGAEAEDYYLFFGKNSVHTGNRDEAAFAVAETLLSLEDAP